MNLADDTVKLVFRNRQTKIGIDKNNFKLEIQKCLAFKHVI